MPSLDGHRGLLFLTLENWRYKEALDAGIIYCIRRIHASWHSIFVFVTLDAQEGIQENTK